jgi:sulfate permease, SulP family
VAVAAGEGRRGRVVTLLLPATAGLVAGTMAVVIATSFGVLIFGTTAPAHLGRGIALTLSSSAVIAAVTAARSSFPGSIAGAQDNTAIVLALLAGAIAGGAPATLDATSVYVTVVAAIAVATLVTGGTFLLLGRLRLGGLVRFVPYPVVGGFLAGTGWLLVVGGLEVLVGRPLGLRDLVTLGSPDVLLRWLPAVAGAAGLLLWLRRSARPGVLPAGIALAIGGVHVGLAVTGTAPAAARADGWLLGSFPAASWPPIAPGDLASVEWARVVAQWPTIGSLVLVATLSLLLSASGIEIAVGRDVDLDRELEAAGVANLLAGLGGGVVGYHYTSITVLVDRMGGARRATGAVAAGVLVATLALGFGAIAFVPVPVVGALLVLLGLAFLTDWLVDGRRSLPPSEYALVVLIVATIGGAGLLAGIGMGLGLAVLLFVVRSSRVTVVKHALSGRTYASNVERPVEERRALDAVGDRLLVLELQGFVFFGTATSVVRALERRSGPPPDLVVLDLRRTTGIDSSAVFGIVRLVRRLRASGAMLVLSGVVPARRRQLEQAGLAITDDPDAALDTDRVPVFPDLDRGVQWCEERQLARLREGGALPAAAANAWDPAGVLGVPGDGLDPYLERRSFAAGERLLEQGEAGAGLLLVTAGQVSAMLVHTDGPDARLRTLPAGTIVGEIGFALGVPATATVVADTDVEVAVLTPRAVARMERDDPALAIRLHRRLVQLASERLAAADRTIDALLD